MKHSETTINIWKYIEIDLNMSSNILISRLCDHCGNSFIARTTVTRFCSKICNSRFYKKRMRDKKILKSIEETQEKTVSNSNRSYSVDKPFLNVNETCLLLGVSRTTLWRLIKNERLKVTKIGSRIIIAKENIYKLFK